MTDGGGDASTKDLLREEFGKRVREAVQTRDWNLLEHWAKQWIQFDPKFPDGFKWLARSAVALNKVERAAYAYSRLLDFEPNSEEAKNFFSTHPSTVDEKAQKLSQTLAAPSPAPTENSHMISPERRQKLSVAEFELAKLYEESQLFALAARCYAQSFDWFPSKASALGTARAYHFQRQSLEAIRYLREKLFHFPTWIEGRIYLGRVLFELGKSAEAQKEWQSVLQQDPHNNEALNFLRGVYSGRTI